MKKKLLRESKYKKTVDAVYGENGPNMHNIQTLQQYALMTPGKLPKIGKYICRKAKEALKEKKQRAVSTVETCMTIFNELIKTCHVDLALFESSVREMMTILLSSTSAWQKALGTDTFLRFAEHGGIQYDLESYVHYFLEMSCSALPNDVHNPDAQEHKQLRVYGLRGLHAYILMTEDLDNLIAHYVGSSNTQANATKYNLIEIFLDNMQYPETEPVTDISKLEREANVPWQEASISALAIWCLKDMGARVNNITIRPLCESILAYMDGRNLWDRDFSFQAFKALSLGVQPQLYSTIIRFLLEHLDRQIVHETDKPHVIKCIENILPQNIAQPMAEVLSCLVRQLTHVSNDGENAALASAIISCIGSLGKAYSDPLQRIEAMNYILGFVSDKYSPKSKLDLSMAILKIAEFVKPLPMSKAYPPSFIAKLALACCDTDPKIRLMMQMAIVQLLKNSDLLSRISTVLRTQSRNSGNFVAVNPYETFLHQIHSSLSSHSEMENNTPPHFVVIFETHMILLEKLQVDEVVYLVPSLFLLQSNLAEKNSLQSVSGHSLIAALLLKIAESYSCAPLVDYVRDILAKRDEAKLTDHYLQVSKGDLKVIQSQYEEAPGFKMNVLFDKEIVVNLLSQVPKLTEAYENVRNLLATEVSRNIFEVKSDDEYKSLRRKIRSQPADLTLDAKKKDSGLDDKKQLWNAQTFRSILTVRESSDDQSSFNILPYDSLVQNLSRSESTIANYLERAIESINLEIATDNPEDEDNSVLALTFPSFVSAIGETHYV